MAGHNKWSKIKHKKSLTDAQKGKVFGKMARALTAESKKCGGDRTSPGLRAIIDKAKSVNMPTQNIDRAVERGMGDDAVSLEPATYEAYGPGGCALIIETLTDNRNRTAAEVRHILSKHNSSLGVQGSASWMFTKQGDSVTPTTTVEIPESDSEKLESLMSELTDQDDVQEVHTNAV